MEKILEKSGKSQGILSVRKSGNPVIQAHIENSKVICYQIKSPQLRIEAGTSCVLVCLTELTWHCL